MATMTTRCERASCEQLATHQLRGLAICRDCYEQYHRRAGGVAETSVAHPRQYNQQLASGPRPRKPKKAANGEADPAN